jgi:hypothetical protein
MALGDENVLVFTGQDQQLRFIGQRLDSRVLYDQLPPPVWLPKSKTQPRTYTEWLPEAAKPIQPAEQPAADSMASAEPPSPEVQEGEGANDASGGIAQEPEAMAKRAAFNEAEFGIEPVTEDALADEDEVVETDEPSNVSEMEVETAVSDTEVPPAKASSTDASADETSDASAEGSEEALVPPKKFDDQAFQ